jgi:S-adenosyl-L-methionine hydrolase (adenosine-forming)
MATRLGRRPVIGLLTDFGLRDHYVAAMKGVMLGICPDASLVDISHEIPPQDILTGALELEAVVPYFPSGSVIVAVVDPGVGSARRGVAIEVGSLRLVGPDNGIFSMALRGLPEPTAVELTNRAYTLASISRTFEGRDRFAPAAAWLARGLALDEFGPTIGHLAGLDVPGPVVSVDGVDGVVLRVDRFGNLVTNIHASDLPVAQGALTVRISGATIDGVSATYADVARATLCALVGSTDRLEVAVSGGSAAAVLGAGRGTVVQVRARSGA